MTTQISSNNIQPTTLAALSPVTITGITVTNSSWTPLDDSAVSTSGGFIVITGTNFATGCNVIISSTNATSVAFVNSTTLRVQVPTMSAGTYVVYVTNTNGTTAIIVNGLTYSGTPTWVTASPLPQGASGTPISIQLSATGDTPLTYALQAGSTLPSGLTLSSSGLLSGTVSGLTVQTTYNFTIEVIDPQLQDSPKAFAITIVAGDQFWDNVTLLLPGTTSTSIFNDDASTNNFPITVFGDTRPNNFGPYTPGYYSNFFDGTGDFLTVPDNAALQMGTGNFTIEFWINFSSIASYQTPFDKGYTSSGALLFQTGDGNGRMVIYANGSAVITESGTATVGTWIHYALVRNGSTLTLYRNGTSSGTATNSTNFNNATNLAIGAAGAGSGTPWPVNGYISNLRVVKGTAVYTSNFTPSTIPLTDITGTSLLTCQSNRFIDNSTNNFAITRNGDTRIDGFDSFVPSSSTATLGSTYFDGNGDYLSTAGNAAFAMGTGDFTLEAWIYPTSFASYWPITGQFASLSTGQGFNLFALNSSRQIELYYDGQTYAILSSATATLNTWNHVTVARQGSTIRGFINGVLAGTITYSGIFGTSSSNLEIGGTTRSGGNLWATGYISNARVVKGTALYTTAFTPPAAPLTAVAGTSLLTCQTNQPNNNNMFLDSSTNNFLITRNGNTTQGTFSPYAENWSNYFDGSTGYLAIPNNAAFAFGSGSLTVEAWINTGVRTDFQSVIGTFDGGSNAWYIHTNASGTITYGLSASAPYVASVQVCDNIWHHVAMVRNGSSDLRFYVDGVLADNRTDSSQPTPAAEIRIGSLSSGFTRYFNGYISNVRVVKGTAVYTSNFTPSTTPLQPIPNTSLLTCRDSSFVDDSGNRFTVTRNGNASVQKVGPFAGTTLPTPYYGAFFDGTGDHLTIPSNVAFNFSTEDLTIECWIYPTAFNSFNYWYSNGDSSVTALKAMYQSNGNQGISIGNWGGSDLYFTGASVLLNSWNHIAITRQSGTWRGFVNGVLAGSSTTSLTIPSGQQSYIGTAPNFTANATGYISNFRIVKGTAVYTTAFTPPTQPLIAITGTSLLTCQSATFIDNSTNNFAITAAGNSQPTFFNPFTVTYSTLQNYSPSVFGGSMYFDGTGDFLSVPNNAAFAYGTGDFTIESWIYVPSVANASQAIVDNRTTSTSATGFYFGLASATIQIFSQGVINLTGGTIVPSTWTHVAVTRQGSTIRLFVNGVQVNTATNSTNWTDNALLIGAAVTFPVPITGYISDLRIIKGQALYTSNFVPSNQPLTAVQNSVLLLNGTAAAIYDASAQNDSETLADSNLSTSIVKFGNTSMFFDGTGDFLRFDNSTFRLISGNFTIECHFYETSATGFLFTMSSRNWWPQNTAGEGMNGLAFGPRSILLGIGSGGGAQYNYSSGATLNTWNHIAVCRVNSTVSVYINGLQVLSQTINNQPIGSLNTSPGIGLLDAFGGTPRLFFTGYIQDFRITSGVARYTTNFTPPTTPFLTN